MWLPDDMRMAPRLDPTIVFPPVTQKFSLLIIPFYRKDPHGSLGKHVLTPTLALTSIAASTPRDWSVAYWDENLLQGTPPVEPMPQVVGITVHLTFARRAYELAAWFRRGGAKVVMGGPHVVSCPEEVKPHADAVVIGEGVQAWPSMLRDVAHARLQPVYQGSYRKPYREEPAPDRTILPRRAFLTTTSLNATRGCHNRCDFCYLSTDGLHVPYQQRDPEQVAAEFIADGQPYGVFTDNNLGSDPDYLRELCAALRPVERIWSAAVSLDVTNDPSLVREMALAGCTGVFVGFESLSNENLADARKRSPRTEDYARRAAIFHENGIQVNASFVFGFDHDQPDVFARTVEWIEQARLECATFHILTPYPGTPLFAKLKREGRILHRDWDRYDTAHVVFEPKGMSAEELYDGYAWCYRRLFSHRSIWRRRPSDPRAVLPYLAMSYLYKRSNWLWHLLIRHQMTARVWRPLVGWTRRRHLRFRRKLAARSANGQAGRGVAVLSAGV